MLQLVQSRRRMADCQRAFTIVSIILIPICLRDSPMVSASSQDHADFAVEPAAAAELYVGMEWRIGQYFLNTVVITVFGYSGRGCQISTGLLQRGRYAFPGKRAIIALLW